MIPTAADYPRLLTDTMNDRYGLHVSHVGEDGSLFVLGHHDDKRRVIAALNAEQRIAAGEGLTCDVTADSLPGLVAAVASSLLRETYAVAEDPPDGWWMWMRCDRSPSAPGAFPITLLEA